MSTVLDPFIETDELAVDESAPKFESAGDKRDYIWNGARFPRVTWYLGHVTGEYLMGYAAKVAALSAARPLIDAGLFVPAAQPPQGLPEYDPWETLEGEIEPNMDAAADEQMMAELEKYVDAFAIRPVDAADAIRMACNYRDHMKAQYRYRDHKGRVGTVAHHYKHDLAMGLTGKPEIEFLAVIASDKVRWEPSVFERYELLGKSRDDVILDLAHLALPHCTNVFNFLEEYRPEYEFIGLEACVVNRTQLHAGTLDDWAIYKQSVWRELNDGKWPFDPAIKNARLIGDLKTSNHLSRMVRFQLAAYAKSEFVGLYADHTEHSIPEFDGMLALHSKPAEGMAITPYAQHHIQPAYDGFCSLAEFVRSMSNMPRVSRGRQEKAAPKGQRDCPISVGGTRQCP